MKKRRRRLLCPPPKTPQPGGKVLAGATGPPADGTAGPPMADRAEALTAGDSRLKEADDPESATSARRTRTMPTI